MERLCDVGGSPSLRTPSAFLLFPFYCESPGRAVKKNKNKNKKYEGRTGGNGRRTGTKDVIRERGNITCLRGRSREATCVPGCPVSSQEYTFQTRAKRNTSQDLKKNYVTEPDLQQVRRVVLGKPASRAEMPPQKAARTSRPGSTPRFSVPVPAPKPRDTSLGTATKFPDSAARHDTTITCTRPSGNITLDATELVVS